ncbi:MAG: M48 family metalloprotease [Syntrophorhabdaceae bacterium]|nr:M48 family metalloprotease [Syntrophorhabdaceae bacterium]
MMRKYLTLLCAILFLAALASCDTSSFGNISQHIGTAMTVVDATSKAARPISDEEEYYVGRAVAAKILGSYQLSTNAQLTRYVNLVGKTVALNSGKPFTYGGYHFAILETNEINAFAAPGGTIFITSGMIRTTAGEDELAAVLAHEAAHINKRDGISAIKSARWTQAITVIGTTAARNYTSGEISQLVSLFEGSIDDVFKTLVVNGYSRSQEYAADEAALQTLAKSGYDPGALLSFLKRLGQRSGSSGGGITQTHPGTADRIENISGKMPSTAQIHPRAIEARSARFSAALR